MKLGGQPARGDNPGYLTTTRTLIRLEAAHAAYFLVPRPATRVPRRFHRAHLRHLCRLDDRLDSLLPPPLRHRTHPVLRLHPAGTPLPLPSLLQPRRLGTPTTLVFPGSAAAARLCPNGTG